MFYIEQKESVLARYGNEKPQWKERWRGIAFEQTKERAHVRLRNFKKLYPERKFRISEVNVEREV